MSAHHLRLEDEDKQEGEAEWGSLDENVTPSALAFECLVSSWR